MIWKTFGARFTALVIATTLLVAAGMSQTVLAASPGTWSVTGALTQARTANSATVLLNGKVLVAGGYSVPGGCCSASAALASAEIYDPGTGTWTLTGSMSVARENHTATLLPNGRVLVTGGNSQSNGTPLTSAELYDPNSGTWTQTGSMSVGRYYFTATRLPNGAVMVAGGCNQANCNSVTASAEVYQPATGTWTRTGSMVLARDYQAAVSLPNGQALLSGGFTTLGLSASAELYNPATGIWTPTGSMLSGRYGHTLITLAGGKVLVVGGGRTAELYDPGTGTWTATGSMSIARQNPSTTLLTNGRVLVAGGSMYQRPRYITLATAEIYDPATGVWSSTGTMNVARNEQTAVLLSGGQLLVIGGYGNGATVLGSTELYTS